MSQRDELEALVREDPYDEGRWQVLEDFLLETEDPRAEIVRGAEAPLALLGPREAELAPKLSVRWRAGYLVEAELDATKAPELVAALVESPASLLRALAVTFDDAGAVAPAIDAIKASPCAASLRALTVTGTWRYANAEAVIDVDGLPLRRLFALGRPMQIELGTARAQLHSLFATPPDTEDLDELLAAELPNLRDLGIAVAQLDLLARPALEPLLSGIRAPLLRQLQLRGARPLVVKSVLARLASSALLPRLRDLVLGDARVSPASLGHAFAHLDTAAVPPGLSKA